MNRHNAHELIGVSYSRVSSEEQGKGTSLNKQEETNIEQAAEVGVYIPSEYCFQDEQTGRVFARKGLQNALEVLESGRADVFVIFDIDRIGRKYTGYAGLRERLHEQGFKIYLSNERRWMSANAYERIGDDVKALVAEAEWEKICERMQDGKVRKVKQGKVLGGGSAPYGYRFVGHQKTRHLEIDEEQAETVRLIFAWFVYGDGSSSGPLRMADILRKLNALGKPTPTQHQVARKRPSSEWSQPTLYRIMKRAAYKGWYEHFQYKSVKRLDGTNSLATRDKSERIGVPCPAIVDEETWEAAQEKLKRNRQLSSRATKNEYLMGRRLRCGKCGRAYGARAQSQKRLGEDGLRLLRLFYRCNATNDIHHSERCEMPYIKASIIDGKTWEWVENTLTNPQWVRRILREMRDTIEGDQAEIRREIEYNIKARERIEAEQMELVRLAAKKLLPEKLILRQSREYDEQLARFERDIKELERRIEDQLTDEEIDTIEHWVERYHNALAGANFAERREFIDFMDVTGVVFLKQVETERGPQVEAWIKLKSRLKVEEAIPLDYKVRIGSTTSVDVARRG